MFAVIVIGGFIVCVFGYEQWKTWRRMTAWRRVSKLRDDAQASGS